MYIIALVCLKFENDVPFMRRQQLKKEKQANCFFFSPIHLH